MMAGGSARRRTAALWIIACVSVAAVLSGCSTAKEGVKNVVADGVRQAIPSEPPHIDANAEEITRLSSELTKQELDFARLQAELDAKAVEAQASETARVHTQAELDKTLDLLAASRVEQEDDINLLVVLIPGLFVSGVAGWALGSRRATRRPQHSPALPE